MCLLNHYMEKINSSAVSVIQLVLRDQLVELRCQSHNGINSVQISIVAGKQVKTLEEIYELSKEMSQKIGINVYSKLD
jgi:ABC-type transporter Mla MlaB component